jgi:uncharacterized delta-60 repeat protein
VDGTPDTTFGSGGLVVTTLANDYLWPNAVTIRPDGRIVVAGIQAIDTSSTNLLGSNFLLVRYNLTDGSLDTSFGNQGIAVSSGGLLVEGNSPLAMATEPDGRIVLAGETLDSTGGAAFAVARFLVAGPVIGSFTASSPNNPVTASSSLTLAAGSITDANPGAVITQVEFYYYDASGNKVTLGTVTQPTAGAWTLTSTPAALGLTTGTYTIYAQAEDNYGVFSDPVSLTLTVL